MWITLISSSLVIIFETLCHVSDDPPCRQDRPPVLCVPVFQRLVPGETCTETDLGSVQTAYQVWKNVLMSSLNFLKGDWAPVKPNLFCFQALQVGISGPEHPSSGSSLFPGPLLSPPHTVRSCVLWRPAVWLLGPLTAAEAVQRHHEAGCVWRACGDAEVTGSHPGAGSRGECACFFWSCDGAWIHLSSLCFFMWSSPSRSNGSRLPPRTPSLSSDSTFVL